MAEEPKILMTDLPKIAAEAAKVVTDVARKEAEALLKRCPPWAVAIIAILGTCFLGSIGTIYFGQTFFLESQKNSIAIAQNKERVVQLQEEVAAAHDAHDHCQEQLNDVKVQVSRLELQIQSQQTEIDKLKESKTTAQQ